ncbi:MAG: glutamate racemase [Bradymonadia bacterium]
MSTTKSPPLDGPIGIFDSGLGGLTVASAIAEVRPGQSLIYLGDTARVPYGNRSPATVVRYARNNVAFLKGHKVGLVVVACNTVSAQGLGGLVDGDPTPVVGVIRPGARAALRASRGGAIAVLGTRGTIRSDAYLHAIHELDPGREVIQLPCPLFVPLVEEGWADHEVTRAVVDTYLAPLKGTAVDTIILGCTHYPLLKGVLRAVVDDVLGSEVALVDSATAVAEVVSELVRPGDVALGERRFFVTDEPSRTAELGARFWALSNVEARAAIDFEHVDVEDQGRQR